MLLAGICVLGFCGVSDLWSGVSEGKRQDLAPVTFVRIRCDNCIYRVLREPSARGCRPTTGLIEAGQARAYDGGKSLEWRETQ